MSWQPEITTVLNNGNKEKTEFNNVPDYYFLILFFLKNKTIFDAAFAITGRGQICMFKLFVADVILAVMFCHEHMRVYMYIYIQSFLVGHIDIRKHRVMARTHTQL